MGILTSKEFLGEKKDSEKKEGDTNPSPSIAAEAAIEYEKLRYRFLFKPAPMGKCQANFIDRGKEYHIDLVDKIFELPEDLPVQEKLDAKEILLRNEFIDVSLAKTEKEVEKIIKEPEVSKIWVYGHPDNSEREKINGNVAIRLDSGEELNLKVKNGIVNTDRREVVQALAAKGFYLVKEVEKKEKVK